ncbi:zinc knuckle [Ostertagia ostertagi]
MAASVRAKKALVTRRTNAALEWLETSEPLLTIAPDVDKKIRASEIRLALQICNENVTLVEESLEKLASTFDELEDPTSEDAEMFDKYVNSAHDAVINLQKRRTALMETLLKCTDTEEVVVETRGPLPNPLTPLSAKLHKSLSTCAAQSHRTEDQRRLFEKLSAIAAQLRDHGEHLDNFLTIQTFLHKFSGKIQKIATEKSLKFQETAREQCIETAEQQGDSSGTLEWWLNTIDGIIVQDEKLKQALPDDDKDSFRQSKERKRGIIPCDFCKQNGHKWFSCSKLPTPSARKNFLIENQRCLNCGSAKHRVANCPSNGCRICQEKHYTATCSKGFRQNEHQPPKGFPSQPFQQRHPKQVDPPPSKAKSTKASKQHLVTSSELAAKVEAKEEKVVLQMHEQCRDGQNSRSKVVLLVGMAEVLDSDNRIRNATVLLDTGTTSRRDYLPAISTFGSKIPSKRLCDVTKLQLRDIEGCHHEIRLHHSDYITSTIERAELDLNDLEFISKHGIKLSVPEKSVELQPQILLGCDYLWNFMMPAGKLILPSGLQLIPTKFGYIISGRQSNLLSVEKFCYGNQRSQEIHTWTIGRIVQLRPDVEGSVREVVVELPSKHLVRRPVNRVIPLEVDSCENSVSDPEPNTHPIEMDLSARTTDPDPTTTKILEQPATTRYNLRKRKPVDYKEENDEGPDDARSPSITMNIARSLPWIVVLLLIWIPSSMAGGNYSDTHQLLCIEGGVQLLQYHNTPYDICAETYCLSFPSPHPTETVKFPPQITVHDYAVKWKIARGQEIDIIEASCQSTPFCSSIDCTLCVENIANPECWPRSALAGIGLLIYLLLLMCYVFFAVPLTLGKPLLELARIAGTLGLVLVKSICAFCIAVLWNLAQCLLGQPRHRRRRHIWSEMVIFLLILKATMECQDVNVLHQNTHFCHYTEATVYLRMTLRDGRNSERELQLRLIPNQPKIISWLSITLTSLGLPPTPILDGIFLSNGVQTAIAPRQFLPPLQCRTWKDALNMTCEVVEDCTCTPAEVKMRCNCRNVNLTSHILNSDHRIPLLRPGVVLNTHKDQLIARIPQLPTAEFVLKIQGKFRTTSLVSSATCTVEDTHCQGCYRCAKGAEAVITCNVENLRLQSHVQQKVRRLRFASIQRLRNSNELYCLLWSATTFLRNLWNFALHRKYEYDCKTSNQWRERSLFRNQPAGLQSHARCLLTLDRNSTSNHCRVDPRSASYLRLHLKHYLPHDYQRYSPLPTEDSLHNRSLDRTSRLHAISTNSEAQDERAYENGVIFRSRATTPKRTEKKDRNCREISSTAFRILDSAKATATSVSNATPPIQQARYEFVNLMAGKEDLLNRRGGPLHFLVKMQQLHSKHEYKKREILADVENFVLAHEWYEILVAADEVEELTRLDFLRKLSDEVRYEPTEPGERGYPDPVEVHRDYNKRNVTTMVQYQMIAFDTLMHEEKVAIDHAKAHAQAAATHEDRLLEDLRRTVEQLQDEVHGQLEQLRERIESVEGALGRRATRILESINDKHAATLYKIENTTKDELEKLEDFIEANVVRERYFGPRRMRKREGTMMCAYCTEAGKHYSDACPRVRTVRERKHLLDSQKRCNMCLEQHEGKCTEEPDCFYCRNSRQPPPEKIDHHASICTKPEEFASALRRRRAVRTNIEHYFQLLEEMSAQPGPSHARETSPMSRGSKRDRDWSTSSTRKDH